MFLLSRGQAIVVFDATEVKSHLSFLICSLLNKILLHKNELSGQECLKQMKAQLESPPLDVLSRLLYLEERVEEEPL